MKFFRFISGILASLLFISVAIAALPAVGSLPQSASITARWYLGETSGTRDDAVGANDLTDNNTVLYAAGQFGANAADFESTNSESLSINDNIALSITGDESFCEWINVESTPSDAEYILVSKSSHVTGRGLQIVLTKFTASLYGITANTEGIAIQISSDGITTTNKGVNFTYGTATWVHVCVVYNASAGEVKFFKNGVQQGTTQTGFPTSQTDNIAPFALGIYPQLNSSAYDGLMQDEVVWPIELTDDEVLSEYNSYFPTTGTPGSNIIF